jgi:flagellar motor switch protein FliM
MAELTDHDFRRPARLQSEEEERLFEWMRAACSILDETCERYFPFEIRPSIQSIETARWSGFFPKLSPAAVGYRVSFVREDRDTLLIMGRPFAKLIVAGLLGDKPAELPQDSELTPTTANVLKFFIDYFIKAVRENWPGGEPGMIQLRQEEPALKRQRTIQQEETVVIVKLHFKLPFGIEEWFWLIPYETVLGLFEAIEKSEQITQSRKEREMLEGLVGEMPTRVTVRLGVIELNAAQLKTLQVGDVLVLDQKLDVPLTVTIAEEATFLGWPGRVGTRQALQIDSLVKG